MSLTPEEKITILQKIKEKIATKDKWTTDYDAKDKQGRPTSPMGFDACQWCINGAIIDAIGHDKWQMIDDKKLEYALLPYLEIKRELDKNIKEAFTDAKFNYLLAGNDLNIIDVNDGYAAGFDAIHTVLDYTIDKLEKQINEPLDMN